MSEGTRRGTRTNKRKYEETYQVRQGSIIRSPRQRDYMNTLVGIRLGLIGKYGRGKNVLDLGCGTGDYLFESRHIIREGVGVDFSEQMIRAAESRDEIDAANLEFIVCDAQELPLKEASFNLIYAFSSLYYVPDVEESVLEVSRVLAPNSVAILELGNLDSLNTVVCKAYPELAIPFHIGIGDMSRITTNARLQIVEWRRFQLLPLWGHRPKWLRPLLHPVWKRILETKVGDKMIDEWICNIPFIQNYCFRQMLICKR